MMILLLAVLLLSTDTEKQNSVTVSENDNAVHHELIHSVHVRDINRKRVSFRRETTIFNDDGISYAYESVFYNSRITIRRFNAVLYDGDGNRVKRLRLRDMYDTSVADGYTLYQDNRLKIADLSHDSYPYTVIFDIETEHNGFFSFPTWHPQYGGAAIEHSRYEIRVPVDYEFRYKFYNGDAEASTTADRNSVTTTWVVNNLPKLKSEPYSEHWSRRVMKMEINPLMFNIGDYSGSLNSWEEFGKWYYELSQGRYELPDYEKMNVLKLIEGLTDTTEIINKLYSHLQQSTRYINIVLGIGGWQTMPAAEVCEKRYGDCKGLTTYLKAMLDTAGITSYPVLINNGYNQPEFNPEFPSNVFNHVILMVPLSSDTLWVEATSSDFKAGYIGESNMNRYALTITSDGGKLVKTPSLNKANNYVMKTGEIIMDENGDIQFEYQIEYSGSFQEPLLYNISSGEAETEAWIKRSLQLSDSHNIHYYMRNSDDVWSSSLVVSAERTGFSASAGGRLLFQPVMVKQSRTSLPHREDRKSRLYIGTPFTNQSVYRFTIPEEYTLHSLPDEVTIQHDFWAYHLRITETDNNTLRVEREYAINYSHLPARLYNEFRDFLNQVSRADNTRLVLIPVE